MVTPGTVGKVQWHYMAKDEILRIKVSTGKNSTLVPSLPEDMAYLRYVLLWKVPSSHEKSHTQMCPNLTLQGGHYSVIHYLVLNQWNQIEQRGDLLPLSINYEAMFFLYIVDSWTIWIWTTGVHLYTDFFFFPANILEKLLEIYNNSKEISQTM